MVSQPTPFLSFEDWLAAERASRDGRTEYVNGEIFAMAGASEAHNLIVANVIVEVLSDATEAWDRGGKFAAYRTLPSLQAFLLLSQRERQAELFVRSADDTWNLRVFSGPDAVVPLAAAEASLTLAGSSSARPTAAHPSFFASDSLHCPRRVDTS